MLEESMKQLDITQDKKKDITKDSTLHSLTSDPEGNQEGKGLTCILNCILMDKTS